MRRPAPDRDRDLDHLDRDRDLDHLDLELDDLGL
jgi:hypothetical protein